MSSFQLAPVSAPGRKEFIEVVEINDLIRRTQSFPRTRWRPERQGSRIQHFPLGRMTGWCLLFLVVLGIRWACMGDTLLALYTITWLDRGTKGLERNTTLPSKPEIVLLHSAYGLKPGVLQCAGRLRDAGCIVTQIHSEARTLGAVCHRPVRRRRPLFRFF